MKQIYSTTHWTSNEDGSEQVEIEYKKSFLRWIFRWTEEKRVFVTNDRPLVCWIDKETGKEATLKEYRQIVKIVMDSR
jgi:hypothetical protein